MNTKNNGKSVLLLLSALLIFQSGALFSQEKKREKAWMKCGARKTP